MATNAELAAMARNEIINNLGRKVSDQEYLMLDGILESGDVSKAPIASPTFTGIPAAPTAAALTNTTQIATTAFVVSMGSTGGNAASDAGLFAKFDGSGFLRAEGLYSDKNLVMGTTNTIGSGVLCWLSGSSNTVTGTGQVNALLGSSNVIDVSSGYGLLFLHGVQNSFRTTSAFGAQGQVLANGVQHYGAAENSIASGFHNRMDGRGTFDTASVTTLATSAQVTGAGGSAMVAFGAGGHAYWHGCVFVSSHHNVDGGQIIGDVSTRDTNDGAVTAGGTLSATLILSKTNGKKLILKPHTLYQFDIHVNAGFITTQEWAAAWSYKVTVHQGAAGTTPAIRSVLDTGISRGSGTLGALPSGWSVAFSTTTQELVVTLTMANPAGSSANWTATGGFRATETAARFDGGAVTTDTNRVALVASRIGTVASSATPAINVDQVEQFNVTALATAITSMTSSLTGTPRDGQRLRVRFKDNGTGRAITWGASFQSVVGTLPTTTTANKITYAEFAYNSADSKWDCLMAGTQP